MNEQPQKTPRWLTPTGFLLAVFGVVAVPLVTVIMLAASAPSTAQPFADWPAQARGIASLRTDQDAGVGDTVHRLSTTIGAKQTTDLVKTLLGWDCGCAKRRAALNAAYPYVLRVPLKLSPASR
jgi:hypothetical protein